ncbi:uncharacterized protein LOC127083330 [Lathyrus oleraceus]|uniref:Transferring glycosyl group transferase n=1 Tax=Pisum sativum TaxID=3888 RepID=A0A9D4X3K5_PEA|nr:uncharacterized protein LOC127083330 [Pisum sativum]KAI5412742.1 hypothetical protein KIW84_057391 [Pisum sativum]
MKSLLQTQPLTILISFCAISFFILISILFFTPSKIPILDVGSSLQQTTDSDPTDVNHLVFGIASTGKSWADRKKYVKLWWNKIIKGCVFVDNLPPEQNDSDDSVPPLCVSEDTSKFLYTCKGGLRSAIRVARIVKEIVGLNNHSNVRWYVFGDDDTVFFPENLVKTLSKYDHRLWYYVGAYSENYEGSYVFGFGMAFGGGGFAISASLANVLYEVFDSCIERYSHLYGSDARVFSCISELGVGLTYEPGFHQVDLSGNIFGLLASHPLSLLLSLHHLDLVEPIFPQMTTSKSLQHLFEAANVDSLRILQQTVCYDKQFSRTISVSWGYAVQIFQYNELLPNILRVRETFRPWRENLPFAGVYTFSTTKIQKDSCERPTIFYLDNVSSGKDGIVSNYTKSFRNCSKDNTSLKNLEVIKVVTKKLDLNTKQVQTLRRQCCDVLHSNSSQLMEIAIRECRYEELIYMH